MAPPSSTPATTLAASRRRSERQQVASTTAAWPEPPKKPPRRSSKTDPTVKPMLFWSPEEVATIVSAWRYCVANPPERPRKTAGGFNARMYARFLELLGGSSIRVLQSVIAKKQLLNNSYEFIIGYNQKRRDALAAKTGGGSAGGGGAGTSKKAAPASSKKLPAKGKAARGRAARTNQDDDEAKSDGDAATEDDENVNYWFELTKAQQKSAAMKMFMTDQRQYALLNMDRRTFDSMVEISKLEGKLSIRQPWRDDEVALLFRAWREAITTPFKGGKAPTTSVNSRMYQNMVAFSNGTLRRTKQSVVLKKDSMKASCEFILAYNERVRLSDAESGSKKKPLTWFALTQREQERLVARNFPKSGFMYFTDAQFDEIDALMKDTEIAGPLLGGRQAVMWIHDEQVLLVRAWRDIVDRPRRQLRPNVTIGSCIYERFMALGKGKHARTERSTVLKLESMKNMHEFIVVYNEKVAKSGKKDWFSLERAQRKRKHLDMGRASGTSDDRARTFADFDQPMFDALTKILSKKLKLDAITFKVPKDDEVEHERGVSDDDDGDENDDDDDDDEGSEESEASNSEYESRARSNRGRKKPTVPEPEHEGDDDDTETATEDDDDVGAESQASTAYSANKRYEKGSHSFLQLAKNLEPALIEEDFDIHREMRREVERMEDAARESDTDEDEDEEEGNHSATSTRSRRSSAGKTAAPTTSRAEKKSQKPVTPTTFSLHELADLAMRVNNAVSSSAESDANTADAEGDDSHEPEPDSASEQVHKQHKLRPEIAAIVHVLEKQSDYMLHAMREIRDEMKQDREDRERFREEIRIDREERRKYADDKARKRSRSGSEDRSPSKKKSSRRLSVQRDGFVVRL